MRLAVVASALALVAASGWNSVLAQAQSGSPREAPIGHRQPTASSAPQDPELTPAEKKQKELDEALDKKLKSICRGC
jgi:hypothetical protein